MSPKRARLWTCSRTSSKAITRVMPAPLLCASPLLFFLPPTWQSGQVKQAPPTRLKREREQHCNLLSSAHFAFIIDSRRTGFRQPQSLLSSHPREAQKTGGRRHSRRERPQVLLWHLIGCCACAQLPNSSAQEVATGVTFLSTLDLTTIIDSDRAIISFVSGPRRGFSCAHSAAQDFGETCGIRYPTTLLLAFSTAVMADIEINNILQNSLSPGKRRNTLSPESIAKYS